MLTAIQQEQLERKGIAVHKLVQQLKRFETGFPVVQLVRAAVKNDGIMTLNATDVAALEALFNSRIDDLRVLKFVPASGAATRMFKFLHEFLRDYDPVEDSINSYINKTNAQDLFAFFVAIEKFPFYDTVMHALKTKYDDWQSRADRDKKVLFVQELLHDTGFNYATMPKGLVPFHKYKDHSATAFEEHLFEASIYAARNNTAYVHFTIAPLFKSDFDSEYVRIKDIVQHKTNTQFEISFSHQSESTDTIAVDATNKPLVLEDGTFYFRPAGHGALLENLNTLDADLIFIKNIDNVTTSSMEQEVSVYKKILAGLLISIQERIFKYLRLLDRKQITPALQIEIEDFLKETLCCVFPDGYKKYAPTYQLEFIHDRLNRPLRVCGMVKNEGEPGGGPFWVKNAHGETSIEIIESAQVDTTDGRQAAIFKGGTHFNPVDLVCGVRDYNGYKFDLAAFCDVETGFITTKTYMGTPIKAQELPGLWNGGMAFWNTIFVEVPLFTFNPVKTVNDLLKPAHQL